jgi:hypothetical protein
MAKVNLSEASKLVGKNRTTIWRHVRSGKLSAERDQDGLPFVDTSELLRVYGELKIVATVDDQKKAHEATPSYVELVKAIEQLRKEQLEMKEQITNLTHRLSYTPETKEEEEPHKIAKPEQDQDWPKEVKTMADVILRGEIKDKYK